MVKIQSYMFSLTQLYFLSKVRNRTTGRETGFGRQTLGKEKIRNVCCEEFVWVVKMLTHRTY